MIYRFQQNMYVQFVYTLYIVNYLINDYIFVQVNYMKSIQDGAIEAVTQMLNCCLISSIEVSTEQLIVTNKCLE